MQPAWKRGRHTFLSLLTHATTTPATSATPASWNSSYHPPPPFRYDHHHQQQQHVEIRSYSHHSSEQPALPPLKAELRRLFKLVHPDLFHHSPHEQATNQRSFQLLQEYLDVAKGKETPKRPSYHFVFYLREYELTSNKKVELLLPAPQVRHHPQRGAELSPLTRAALGRLLAACGLSAEVSGQLDGSEDSMNLFDFFQRASEIQRQSEASILDLEQQVRIVKSALQLGRRVAISFRHPLSDCSFQEQLEALGKLAKAFDETQESGFAGCVLMLGDAYGVDDAGNVWISGEDDAKSWAKYLNDIDGAAISSRQSAAKAIRLKEFKVARLMEVEMIFADDTLANKLEYSFFLDQLADSATESGAVGAGKFHELPIRVVKPSSSSGIPNSETECNNGHCQPAIDKTMGYVSVSVVESPLNLHRFIEKHGEEALKYRRKFKLLDKQMEDLKAHVRKHLRLRHLEFDKTLGRDQLQSACLRLLRNAPVLQNYTEGLGICISDEHRLPIPGCKELVYLKWNFSLSHL